MDQQCKVIKPDSDLNKLLCDFTSFLRSGYVEIGEEKTVMPSKYIEIANDIENFEVRDNDVFVMTHPKAGTTWCQEMVWLIQNNLDYEGAKQSIGKRFPFIEFECLVETDNKDFVEQCPDVKFPPGFTDTVKHVRDMPSPRFIKTHLPWSLLPKVIRDGTKKPKIVYVARNPKDVCVSYFNHCRIFMGFNDTFENFSRLFLGDKLLYGPFWKSVLPMWERRHESNILFIHYEDMKKDLKSVIKKVAAFFEKDLTDDDVMKLEEHLSFESMKKNSSVNHELGGIMMSKIYKNGTERLRFMRSGTVGSYKADMTPEMIKLFDEWTEENTGFLNNLYGSDLF